MSKALLKSIITIRTTQDVLLCYEHHSAANMFPDNHITDSEQVTPIFWLWRELLKLALDTFSFSPDFVWDWGNICFLPLCWNLPRLDTCIEKMAGATIPRRLADIMSEPVAFRSFSDENILSTSSSSVKENLNMFVGDTVGNWQLMLVEDEEGRLLKWLIFWAREAYNMPLHGFVETR